FEMAYTADDIVRIHRTGRMAALIGVEGGNQINESLASLRQLYAAGARYMTLTHAINIRWADSATPNPTPATLTPLGQPLASETTRRRMLAPPTHIPNATLTSPLETTTAPILF